MFVIKLFISAANPQTAIRSVAPHNMVRPPLQNRPTNPNMNQIPIISNVVSLAPQGKLHVPAFTEQTNQSKHESDTNNIKWGLSLTSR